MELHGDNAVMNARGPAFGASLLVPALLVALAGCSHPAASPNAAASALQAGPQTPLATQPTLGQEVGAVAANQLEVTFISGDYRLSPPAAGQLDLAARLFRDVHPVRMYVAGHADSTGDEYGNLMLSARRAQAVKEGLVARGIPADRLLLQAYGSSQPAKSQDVQAADNRRVVVTWSIL